MIEVVVELRNVPGTEAAFGWAGAHTLVVDRPDGVAGGAGLGFNGGQLLALAIGGCLCNDLRYVGHAMWVTLGEIAISVALEIAGEPPVARSATMTVVCRTADGSPADAVLERALVGSTVANSVRQGFPVTVRNA